MASSSASKSGKTPGRAVAKPVESLRAPQPAKPQESKASVRGRAKSVGSVPTVPARSAAKPKSKKNVSGSKSRPVLLEGELPASYELDRLVAIPKDPDWTHLYWETSPETRRRLSESGGDVRLRGFDTTGVLFDGGNAPVALDIEVAPYSRSWYAKLPYQGRVYTFEFGWVDSQGEWTGIARSQPVGFEPGMLFLNRHRENVGSLQRQFTYEISDQKIGAEQKPRNVPDCDYARKRRFESPGTEIFLPVQPPGGKPLEEMPAGSSM